MKSMLTLSPNVTVFSTSLEELKKKSIIMEILPYGWKTWYLKTWSWGEYLFPGGMRKWEWRRLHNEELHSLYRSPNIVRVIKCRGLWWENHVARMEEDRSAFKTLTSSTTGRILLGRPWRWWKDCIRMDFYEIDVSTRNWVDWAQDSDYWRALVNAALNLRVPETIELIFTILIDHEAQNGVF